MAHSCSNKSKAGPGGLLLQSLENSLAIWTLMQRDRVVVTYVKSKRTSRFWWTWDNRGAAHCYFNGQTDRIYCFVSSILEATLKRYCPLHWELRVFLEECYVLSMEVPYGVFLLMLFLSMSFSVNDTKKGFFYFYIIFNIQDVCK